MKKVFAICLMIVMVMAMSVNVFAASGAFVSSPSGNAAPTLVSFDPSNDSCTARLVITCYAERDNLPADLKTLIEKAYADIVGTDDLTTLDTDLAAAMAEKKIAGKDLAVSDLFDLQAVGCDSHEEHKNFSITLDAETLDRFVALLHMNKDGNWELVEDAALVDDGEHLSFTVDSLSPFAIVVNTGADAQPAADYSWIWILIVVLVVVAGATTAVVIKVKQAKGKKQNG